MYLKPKNSRLPREKVVVGKRTQIQRNSNTKSLTEEVNLKETEKEWLERWEETTQGITESTRE